MRLCGSRAPDSFRAQTVNGENAASRSGFTETRKSAFLVYDRGGNWKKLISHANGPMKLPIYPSGLFALCLLFFASCEKKVEPLPNRVSPETRARGDSAQATAAENPDDTSKSLMSERHEYLELIMHNSTDGNIDATAIVLGKRSCTFGIVGKESSAGYLGWTHPVGTNAVVRWRDSGKTKRESLVDFTSIYHRDTAGSLTFTIDGTNVTVTFKKIDRK